MLQDEASNFDNLFFSEAGRACTLAYKNVALVQPFMYILMPTLIISRAVYRQSHKLREPGYYCIGAAPIPAGHAAFVQELCPYKMRLDPDTAHVVRGVRDIVRIDPRCVACSAKRRVCRQLEKRRGHDVLSGRGDSLRTMLLESAESPWRLHDRSGLFSRMLR